MAGYIGGGQPLAVLSEIDPTIPTQTDNSGKYLTTDGTTASWATVEALPDAIDINASAPADSLAIDASGDVGIKTTSPSHPLHVLATAAGETTVKFESNQAGSMNVALDVDADRDCLLQFQEAGTTRWDFLMNGSSGTNPLLIRDDGGTTQGSFDQSGNFKFNSGYGSAATAYGCRAWVKFDGTTNTGGNCTINGGGNVSTVVDNGTGDYRINFITSMPDTNYCAVAASDRANNSTTDMNLSRLVHSYTLSSVRLKTGYPAGVNTLDNSKVCTVAVFR